MGGDVGGVLWGGEVGGVGGVVCVIIFFVGVFSASFFVLSPSSVLFEPIMMSSRRHRQRKRCTVRRKGGVGWGLREAPEAQNSILSNLRGSGALNGGLNVGLHVWTAGVSIFYICCVNWR